MYVYSVYIYIYTLLMIYTCTLFKPFEKPINLEAKEIAAGVKLDDRIEYMAKASAYITLKDDKGNFRSAHPCRLKHLCKTKSERSANQS